MVRRDSTIRWAMLAAAAAQAACAGCLRPDEKVAIENTLDVPITFAVAPVLNFSGEFSFDPVKTADLLASELAYVRGANVLPVNRVVAVLASQGRTQIDSPAHAVDVAESVGADAIIVAGITEYDAYTPIVGVVMQIYTARRPAMPSLDPTTAARQARPVTLSEMSNALVPVGQVQRVYNADHVAVSQAVREYAALRGEGDDHLFGWRQYIKVQTLYLRFCWHDAINRILADVHSRQALLAGVQSEEPSA